MAIKMRHNNKPDSVCDSCGDKREDTLEMFDICIGEYVVTICDVCNNTLLEKTLKGEVEKNGRVKTQHDMKVLRKRGEKSYRARFQERQERDRLKKEK